PCQPEHGIGDNMSTHQSKLAVESRAYPLFRYNPDEGKTPEECFDLEGNPAIDEIWPTYTLKYMEGAKEKSMDLPMTFADFAVTEARFRKHFRKAPQDTWNEDMVPLAEFLEMDEDEREGKFPFIWAVDKKKQLNRVLVAKPIVESCEDRRDFWIMLRALAGADKKVPPETEIEQKVRSEIIGKIASGLMQLAGGNGEGIAALTEGVVVSGGGAAAPATAPAATAVAAAAEGEYMAPWIETENCTSCDECIKINPNIFAYNENKKAYIKDPKGGPYSDIVKAAEKCTAMVIHPGLPADRSEKDIDKWIKRAEKYN
ncbi:MAG: 4Fe-4S domain-containing protein, partial [Calditrichia bacterium]